MNTANHRVPQWSITTAGWSWNHRTREAFCVDCHSDLLLTSSLSQRICSKIEEYAPDEHRLVLLPALLPLCPSQLFAQLSPYSRIRKSRRASWRKSRAPSLCCRKSDVPSPLPFESAFRLVVPELRPFLIAVRPTVKQGDKVSGEAPFVRRPKTTHVYFRRRLFRLRFRAVPQMSFAFDISRPSVKHSNNCRY